MNLKVMEITKKKISFLSFLHFYLIFKRFRQIRLKKKYIEKNY